MEDINLNHLKLKVNDTHRKNEKKTTKTEPSDDTDVIKKTYVDTKLSKLEGHLSLVEKDYNEYKLLNDKHSEKVLTERAVETTIHILHYKGLF